MNSVPRKLTLGLVLAVGVAACGDDVTVTNPPVVTPVVRSVVVSPSTATIAQGGSFTFGAAVDADAGLARTVTWTASGGTGITVSTEGVASASATAVGVASICAASTADAVVKGCAQLTILPAVGAATVEINSITVGCDALAAVLQPAGVCGLQFAVATNNVAGQMDVQVNVNRPQGSQVSSVILEVLGGPTLSTIEATQTLTLTQDVAPTEGITAQATPSNRVVFSVQTGEYSLAANNAATVKFLNGQKKIRVRLTGGTSASSVAETQVTFRNVNGFHVTPGAPITTPTANNTNGVAVRQTSATGFSWFGGTPLTFTVSPVNYTGVAITGGASAFFAAFGTGCQIGVGPAFRASVGAPLTAGVVTGTLTYSNNPANATANNIDGYEMAPGCSVAGEVPSGNGIDATGNSFITVPLGGVFGPFNTLNNPLGPVVSTLPTVTTIRLDNNGPNPIPGYAVNPNGRLNGWMNAPSATPPAGAPNATALDKLNLAAVLAGPNPTQIANASPDGVVLPTNVVGSNNLPVDNGFGGTTSFRARGGGTIGGLPCNTAALTNYTAAVNAACTTFAQRTTVAGLAETADYFTYGLIVQSVDAFLNGTNPPTVGGPFALIQNPFDPGTGIGGGHPLVAAGVLYIGVDNTAPTIAALGGNGTTATNTAITQLSDAGGLLVGANSCAVAGPVPFVQVALPQGNAGKCWIITAQDQATALPAIASGIATIPGAQGELWISEQRRDGSGTSQFWCPAAVFPAATGAGGYQTSAQACPTWNVLGIGATTFNMAAGAVNPAWIAGSIIDAYYGISAYTRDQAGNQSATFVRQLIHDATFPTVSSAAINPSIIPATGTMTISSGVFDNLDVGRAVFGLQFPLLAATADGAAQGVAPLAGTHDGSAPQYIRTAWANRPTGAANPTGFLFDGPNSLFLTLQATLPAMRSLETVIPGGAFPSFVTNGCALINGAGAAVPAPCAAQAPTGTIQFPGVINPAITQAQAQLTNILVGAQSVTHHTAGFVGVSTTAVSLAQTGMPGGTAFWANQHATNPPFAGMGWAVINNSRNANNGNIDISGNANNANVNSGLISAVAVGHAVGQVLPNPFPNGVTFYTIDKQQYPAVFTAGTAAGTALVPVCTAGSPLNDQVANSWTFSCTINPSVALTGVNFEFEGFSNASNGNFYGLNNGQGHLGGLPWATGASVTGTFLGPIVAIGVGQQGNGLATIAGTNFFFVR